MMLPLQKVFTCAFCGAKFTLQNGSQKNRRYCYKCVPFGKKVTRTMLNQKAQTQKNRTLKQIKTCKNVNHTSKRKDNKHCFVRSNLLQRVGLKTPYPTDFCYYCRKTRTEIEQEQEEEEAINAQ
ncbi:MAG: hypothetical protein FWF27_05030 [Candidatus Bathyarchaeota archaeon]|nr:hypothetical protein [Candidatus Termiticorpusculum sp.]